MTELALERLSPKSKDTLEILSTLIWRAKNENREDLKLEYRMKLKGYLKALVDCSVLTDLESKVLYLYFVDKDWTDRKIEKEN